MKVGEFLNMLKKQITENGIKDTDDIIIVNSGEDRWSNIYDVTVSIYSDDSKKVVITNLY
jgi:hypothetical protein